MSYVFKEIEVEKIEQDADQPRKDFGTRGDENRLLVSIRDIGVQQPITVTEYEAGRFRIIDGHRRHICAQRLGLKKVPCLVEPKMSEGELELRRFEIQNNRRPWKPLERSEALARIKACKGFRTNKELAKALHMSESLVGNSLNLRKQKLEYLEMMERFDLSESYRIEFVRLKPKLRKIKDLEVEQIIRILFDRVQHQVIKSAKDFRKLGRIFLRATANEEELHKFLNDPDMRVSELEQRTIQSGFSLAIEQIIQKVSGKRKNAVAFSSQEKAFLLQLRDLLNKAF